MTGFELSYPGEVYEDLVVTVRGTTPPARTVAERNVMLVYEMDTPGDVVPENTFVEIVTLLPS